MIQPGRKDDTTPRLLQKHQRRPTGALADTSNPETIKPQGDYPLTVGMSTLYSIGHEVRFSGAGWQGGYELRCSSDGHVFYVWKPPVPRIEDQVLDCVIYLYPSVGQAAAGEQAGGTGFLVGMQSEANESRSYLYAVTNSHVIREGESPVIRLNTKDGNKAILELDQEQWVHHQDGDDIAVCPFALANPNHYAYRVIPRSMFLTKGLIEQHNVGAGDDVFMVGRFISHEGRQRNTPIVRFGNISMMPWEPITHERGIQQESFLLEMRSLSGFSGSPVFVDVEVGGYLLGVDWAHMASYEKVKKVNPITGRLENVPEGHVVKSNSGQMAAVPAWKLQELLDQEELVAQRKRSDEQLARQAENSPAVLDIRMPAPETDLPVNPANTFTKDDFEDALDRVSRREPPPDQGS